MSEEDIDDFQKEISILEKLVHPGLVGLHAVYEDPIHFCMVIDYMNHGDVSADPTP